MTTIIKKKPVIPNDRLYKAAGFGAGGMTGTMVVCTAIYIAAKKLSNSSSGKDKIHPHT